ncbi:MAG: hypothetical protein KDB79_08625 [Acidobacteria bacterium]|nr:hypothetical protein [Acidobacteriota bacterium]
MNKQKSKNQFSFFMAILLLILVALGCDLGPSRIDSLETFKDKDGKDASTSFKADEPIVTIVKLTSFSGKAKVRSFMSPAEDMDGLKKGETIEGTGKTVEINDDQFAHFTFLLGPNFPPGKYTVTAELLGEDGKVQNTQSTEITVQKSTGDDQKSN